MAGADDSKTVELANSWRKQTERATAKDRPRQQTAASLEPKRQHKRDRDRTAEGHKRKEDRQAPPGEGPGTARERQSNGRGKLRSKLIKKRLN